MSAAKHTPGPWRQSVDRGIEQTTIVAAGDLLICHVKWDDKGHWKANARLIAAAPDLLAALQWLVDLAPDPELDTDPVQRREVIKAKAAIAKATGGNA